MRSAKHLFALLFLIAARSACLLADRYVTVSRSSSMNSNTKQLCAHFIRQIAARQSKGYLLLSKSMQYNHKDLMSLNAGLSIIIRYDAN